MGKITIAVDAMGGDNAPDAVVAGCVMAAEEFGVKVLLVGKEEVISEKLKMHKYDPETIGIVNASEVIGTDESPTTALRRKKDSSISVGLRLVKEGGADAFVSAGSTGALLAGATIIIGRIPGVERPALGTCLPSTKGFSFLLDSGANVDSKPSYLLQFGKMGAVYAEHVLGIKNPRVALANIGTEKEKGNALTKEAYDLLEEAGINFTGNIEAREIPFGEADVVVCDGFVGNTILKFAEGMSMALLGIIKEEITRGGYKLAAAILKKPFKNVKRRFDSEEIGGAPFLGLKSLVVKAHGSSNAKAIKNAVKQCIVFVENDIVKKIEDKL